MYRLLVSTVQLCVMNLYVLKFRVELLPKVIEIDTELC